MTTERAAIIHEAVAPLRVLGTELSYALERDAGLSKQRRPAQRESIRRLRVFLAAAQEL